jgi:hypothetical protein
MNARMLSQVSCLPFMKPNMLSTPNGLAFGTASAAVITPPTSIATRLANGNALNVANSDALGLGAQRLKSAVTVPASMNSASTTVRPTPIDMLATPLLPA